MKPVVTTVALAGVIILLSGAQLIAAEEDTAGEEEVVKPAKPVQPVEPAGLRKDRLMAGQLVDGEAKWLKAGKTEFLGIYNADSSGSTVGSLLILPAPGHSPVTPGILSLISSELATKGWDTLAISLPEPDFSEPAPARPEPQTSGKTKNEDAAEPEDKAEVTKTEVFVPVIPDAEKWYADQATSNMEKLLHRLLAAEAELRTKGGQYVLVAQGATAEQVLELISSNAIKPVGLISLNIEHPVRQRSVKIPVNLSAVKIPVLDIYRQVNTAVRKRKEKQHDGNYRQLFIPANDINFRGSEQILLKRIRGWLKKIN